MSVLLKLKPESSDTREETVQRDVMESRSGRPRTEACTFLSEHVTGLLHCFTERLTCSRGLPPCYDHDIIFFTPSVKVKLCLLSLSSNVRLVYGQLRGPTGFLLRLRSTSRQGYMVYDDVLFSVWHELFFTQICNPPRGVTMESRSGRPRTEACTSTWLRCRSGLVQSCYEAAIYTPYHTLTAGFK